MGSRQWSNRESLHAEPRPRSELHSTTFATSPVARMERHHNCCGRDRRHRRHGRRRSLHWSIGGGNRPREKPESCQAFTKQRASAPVLRGCGAGPRPQLCLSRLTAWPQLLLFAVALPRATNHRDHDRIHGLAARTIRMLDARSRSGLAYSLLSRDDSLQRGGQVRPEASRRTRFLD